MTSSLEFDIGPLSWVRPEIEVALQHGLQALSSYVKNPDDPTLLKEAETYWHQVSGALRIVGLDGITAYSEELELQLKTLLSNTPNNSDSTVTAEAQSLDGRFTLLEQAAQKLLHYLDSLLAGRFLPPNVLFQEYARLQAARGIRESSPAELFFPDLSQRAPKNRPSIVLEPPLLASHLQDQRKLYQQGLLRWLRGDNSGAQNMYEAALAVEKSQTTAAQKTFWWCVSGLMESLALGNAEPISLGLKQVCSRIDLQIRRLIEGSPKVAERLHREILYFIASSPHTSELLENIRDTYALNALLQAIPDESWSATDASLHNTLPEALRLLLSIKESWLGLTTGKIEVFPALLQSIKKLTDYTDPLPNADLQSLIQRITREIEELPAGNVSDTLAIEIATALVLVEFSLQNYQNLPPNFAEQAREIEHRLDLFHQGAALPPSRPSDLSGYLPGQQHKDVLQPVIAEIRGNLQRIEQILDTFFRDTKQLSELGLTRALTQQINGALRILGHDQAAALLTSCQEQIDHYLPDSSATLNEPSQEELESLAETLSALEFFIDSLALNSQGNYQILAPFLQKRLGADVLATPAKSAIDPVTAALSDIPSTEESLPLQREQITELLQILEQTPTDKTQENTLLPRTEPPKISGETARLLQISATELDAELLEIYLEEAEEVLTEIAGALAELQLPSTTIEPLKTIRRGFHTIKGSGRMVGLHDLSELAWGIENTLNRWLEGDRSPSTELLSLLQQAQTAFASWISELTYQKTLHLDPIPLLTVIAALDPAAVPERWHSLLPPAPAIASVSLAEKQSTSPVEAETTHEIRIGDHTLSRALYQILIEEAGQHLATLNHELQLLQMDPYLPPAPAMIRAAHTMTGIHRAAGFPLVGDVAYALEQALIRLESFSLHQNSKVGNSSGTPSCIAHPENTLHILGNAITELATLVESIRQGKGFNVTTTVQAQQTQQELIAFTQSLQAPAEYHDAETAAMQAAIESIEPTTVSTPTSISSQVHKPAETNLVTPEFTESEEGHSELTTGIADEIDAQLLPIFLEEATELLPQANSQFRAWRADQQNIDHQQKLLRLLHTLKGSSRMAGAMQFGQLVHDLETKLENLSIANLSQNDDFLDAFEADLDLLHSLLERLAGRETTTTPPQTITQAQTTPESIPGKVAEQPTKQQSTKQPLDLDASTRTMLRVPAQTLERLVNEAGEISIARARIEGEFRSLKHNLLELTQSVIRLRNQAREIEIQAETQMQSRRSELEEQNKGFDPLELDRFTSFQELTRSLAEGVNDVATIQQVLLKGIDDADAALLNQARMNRELQQELMAVRLVPFGTLAERLYRIVRQTAKELQKRANLEIRGSQVELDRSVLEKLAAPLEHLLRNAVDHGLESPSKRLAAQKAELGEITIKLHQESNQIVLTLSDDGGGLNLDAIRERAIKLGLIDAHGADTPENLIECIFTPGFSTAQEVTQISGRGVGMDVVRNEIQSLGGRIEVQTQPGAGSSFIIYLPLTLALAQVVIIRANNRLIALPASLVAQVQQLKKTVLAEAYQNRAIHWQAQNYPLFYFPELLEDFNKSPELERYNAVLLLKSRSGQIAIHVDEMLGNQEVVVKNIGPQLARAPGVTGATVLGTGEIVLIMDPTLLLGRHQQRAKIAAEKGATVDQIFHFDSPAKKQTPVVLIVDDSLTIRKIASRLMTRAGYEPITAKDGLDALQQLNTVQPDVILLDVEMPRMDGFEFAKTVKGNINTRHIPIIMITSRTAEKHRQRALEIGVDLYLGKPYQEEELLHHIQTLLAHSSSH